MTSKNEHGTASTAELFDYTTDAELFSSKFSRRGRQPLMYRRFVSAAEAIRFAIEDLPAQFLVGTYLEVDELRFRARKSAGCTRVRTIRWRERQRFAVA